MKGVSQWSLPHQVGTGATAAAAQHGQGQCLSSALLPTAPSLTFGMVSGWMALSTLQTITPSASARLNSSSSPAGTSTPVTAAMNRAAALRFSCRWKALLFEGLMLQRPEGHCSVGENTTLPAASGTGEARLCGTHRAASGTAAFPRDAQEVEKRLPAHLHHGCFCHPLSAVKLELSAAGTPAASRGPSSLSPAPTAPCLLNTVVGGVSTPQQLRSGLWPPLTAVKLLQPAHEYTVRGEMRPGVPGAHTRSRAPARVESLGPRRLSSALPQF